MTKPADDREYRLNNLGQLEQYLGGMWITVQTARARENDPGPTDNTVNNQGILPNTSQ